VPRLDRAPLATLGLLAVAAGAAASLLAVPPPYLPAVGGAVALRWPRAGALVALALLGAVVGGWRIDALTADPLAAQVGHRIEAVATIEEPWRASPTSARAEAALAGGGRVLLRIPVAAARPPRGARVRIAGRLQRPRGPVRGFDERAWLARRGIHAVLRSSEAVPVGRRGGVWGALDHGRTVALTAYAGAGDDDAGRMLGALALGADDALTPATRDAFRASGLAHLLAVSGGNVALLVAAVLVLVWTFGGSRVTGHAVAVAAVAGYVGLVGPSPSVVRAGVAGVLASAAWLLSRPSDPWHLYAAGLAVLLCRNPYDLLDPGFQLSFAAVAAIILVAPRFREALEGLPFLPGLRAATAVSAACTLVTAPIGWWHFGRLNLIAAVPANVLALPAVPALLWIGLAAGLVAPLSPSAAASVAATGRLPGEYLLGVARFGAALDARTQAYEAPVAAALAVLLALVVLAAARRAVAGRGRRR
jgi:competence protein ComEC